MGDYTSGSQGIQGYYGPSTIPQYTQTLQCTSFISNNYVTWTDITNGFGGQTFNNWNWVSGSTLVCPNSGWYVIQVWCQMNPTTLATGYGRIQISNTSDIVSYYFQNDNGNLLYTNVLQPFYHSAVIYISQNSNLQYRFDTDQTDLGINGSNPIYLYIKNISS